MKDPDNYFYIQQNKKAVKITLGIEGTEISYSQKLGSNNAHVNYDSNSDSNYTNSNCTDSDNNHDLGYSYKKAILDAEHERRLKKLKKSKTRHR